MHKLSRNAMYEYICYTVVLYIDMQRLFFLYRNKSYIFPILALAKLSTGARTILRLLRLLSYPAASNRITGNLKIIPGTRICPLISKGLKCILLTQIDFNNGEVIAESLREYYKITSRKQAYIILTPLNPTFIKFLIIAFLSIFYKVKLRFTGIYIIFLILLKKYRVPTIYVLRRNMKNIRFFFYLKTFLFLL